MVVPLNRSVVLVEVMQWARYQLASMLQCPLSAVIVNVSQGEKGLEVAFDGPGLKEDDAPDTRMIFRRMMAMARERIEGLNTRRVS